MGALHSGTRFHSYPRAPNPTAARRGWDYKSQNSASLPFPSHRLQEPDPKGNPKSALQVLRAEVASCRHGAEPPKPPSIQGSGS